MSVLGDLPDLASGPSLATAGALLIVGAGASAWRRQGLAEVCVAWSLGFLVLHLLAGLLGGSVATVLAIACALFAVLIVAAPWLAGMFPGEQPVAESSEQKAEPAPAAPEPAAAWRPPAPSTHLWSVDGYRDVTRRSAP